MIARALAVLLVGLVPPILIWGLLYLLMRHELGRRATHRTLKVSLLIGVPCGLIGGVVGIVVVRQRVGVSGLGLLLFALYLAMSLICLWYALRWQGQRRRAGTLLVDIGWRRSRKLLFLLCIVPEGLAAALFLGLAIAHGGKPLYELALAYGMLALAGYMIFIWRAGVQLRERGVLMTTFLPWERIRSYRWEGDTGRTLTLEVTHWYTRQKGWPVSFAIVPGTREQVDQILAQHVPRRSSIQ